jgi:hypothetical protein
MRTVDIRSRFEATGVVRLQGAFAAEQAAAMREAVWRHAERQAGLRPGVLICTLSSNECLVELLPCAHEE